MFSWKVIDDRAIFTLRYIYNDKVSKSMGEARARKWNKMKKKSTLGLPPDRDAHDLKVKIGNYQAYIFLSYHKVDPSPSPLSHEWAVETSTTNAFEGCRTTSRPNTRRHCFRRAIHMMMTRPLIDTDVKYYQFMISILVN